MSILSDIDIKRLVRERQIQIQPFDESNLTPNGYDLTVGEMLIPRLNRYLKEGKAIVPELTWFVVGTKEYIRVPSKICGQVWIRSSWARKVGRVGSCPLITFGLIAKEGSHPTRVVCRRKGIFALSKAQVRKKHPVDVQCQIYVFNVIERSSGSC